MVKKVLKWFGIGLGTLFLVVGILYAVYVQPVLNHLEQQRVVEVDPGLTIVEGGGGNSGIFVSDSLVIVVDTKMSEAAKQFRDRVTELAGTRPILVVNTHYHYDHSSGNRLYPNDRLMASAGYKDGVWIEEGKPEDMPRQWLEGSIDIPMDDDTVSIFALNFVAHTPGDLFVYSHKRKMLFTGDVILNGQVPSVANGRPSGYLEAFDLLQKQYRIETIVPGHGPMGGIEILDAFRTYFNDMKLAAEDPSQADPLLSKYENWVHVPMLMASSQVVQGFKK